MNVEINALPPLDLVGGQFTVLESDPGVFTTLLRKLGVRGFEVTEIFDIDDLVAGKRVQPRGLIFCYPCADDETMSPSKDQDNAEDDPDPDAEEVWFAHQLCNDACATQTILNVALNLKNVRLESMLDEFKRDTEKMSPVMKGLALTNCEFIRKAHNSLARPADVRAALHVAATETFAYTKQQQKKKARSGTSPPPPKRRKFNFALPRKPKAADDSTLSETYHFIGYVPIDGKVWELDGLRTSGPLEVGDISALVPDTNLSGQGWLEVVRPAILRRMQRLQENEHIRYNLLAIVEDQYEKCSDELEMLKRRRATLERRFNEEYADGWHENVDGFLLEESTRAFSTSTRLTGAPGPTYGTDFASRRMDMDMEVLDMPVRKLPGAWEQCVRDAQSARRLVEEEIRVSERAHMDDISRTFDYEPFITTLMQSMHAECLLQPIVAGNASTSTSPKANNDTKKKGKARR